MGSHYTLKCAKKELLPYSTAAHEGIRSTPDGMPGYLKFLQLRFVQYETYSTKGGFATRHESNVNTFSLSSFFTWTSFTEYTCIMSSKPNPNRIRRACASAPSPPAVCSSSCTYTKARHGDKSEMAWISSIPILRGRNVKTAIPFTSCPCRCIHYQPLDMIVHHSLTRTHATWKCQGREGGAFHIYTSCRNLPPLPNIYIILREETPLYSSRGYALHSINLAIFQLHDLRTIGGYARGGVLCSQKATRTLQLASLQTPISWSWH